MSSPLHRARVRPLRRPFVLAVAGSLAVTGCSGPGTDQAAQTAVSFAQLASDSPGRACAMLSQKVRSDLERSEESPCEQALAGLDLPAASALEGAEVYEMHARVVLEGDVLFLARYNDGWRVTAAGCEPQPEDAPYACTLGG